MFKLCSVTMLALLVAEPLLVSAQHPQELVTSTNYRQDDGHQRKESVDGQGNVRGEYSYVDPNGKTITVRYTAGKDGFRVEGDHLPVAPQPLPVQQPQQQQPHYNPPQNQYNSQQNQYNPPQPQYNQYNQQQQSGQYQSAQQQLTNFPSISQPQNSLYNPPQQQYQQQPQAPQYNNYQAQPQNQYNQYQQQQAQPQGQSQPVNAGFSYSLNI